MNDLLFAWCIGVIFCCFIAWKVCRPKPIPPKLFHATFILRRVIAMRREDVCRETAVSVPVWANDYKEAREKVVSHYTDAQFDEFPINIEISEAI